MVASFVNPLVRCGGIEDMGLGLRWDGTTLEQEASRRAAVLAQQGIGRKSVVAIAHSGTAHFFADLFATWKVGAAAACLDTTLTSTELHTVVRFAKAAVLLLDDDANAVGDIGIPSLKLGAMTAAPSSRFVPPLDPNDPALVLFTSGTTGTPKGVVLSFRALWGRLWANIDAIGQDVLARTLVTLPTHFGHGLIGNALTPLAAGGQVILPPTGLTLAGSLGQIIDEYRVSFLSSVPALWRMCTRYNPPSGNSLRRVHVGSAPLTARLWSEVTAWTRAEVVNCYGLTETANWVAGASSRKDGIAEGLIGTPWGTIVAIKDEQGANQQVGEGEIIVRSPALMSGYLDRSDLTASVLHEGWFHTGDRGRVDEQGRIWLTGRIKDEINRAGFKIQPAELDMLLERHPGVAEACVFGLPDPTSGEMVAAAIRPESGANVSQEDLRDWCLERLRRDAIPERWFIVEQIPRNSRGKVSRGAVREMLAGASQPLQSRPDAQVPPTQQLPLRAFRQAIPADRIRKAVKNAWVETFGERAPSSDEPWDESGGDSLDALRLLFSLEREIGVQLTFDILKPGATREDTAVAIERELQSASPSRSEAADDETQPLVLFFPPLEGDMPHIARFRATFGARFRFAVIHYPVWQELAAADCSFDALARSAAEQICAHVASGPIFLFGCSSGGFVAWETARHLMRSGRRIGFLGLIDARRWLDPQEPRENPLGKTTLRTIVRHPRATLALFLPWFVESMAAKHRFTAVRVAMLLAKLLPAQNAMGVHLRLTHQLRREALRKLVLAPLDIPVVLFRSDLFRFYHVDKPWIGPHDYGWHGLSSGLTIVNVQGSHSEVWDAPYCQFLRERLVEAVAAARNRVATVGRPW